MGDRRRQKLYGYHTSLRFPLLMNRLCTRPRVDVVREDCPRGLPEIGARVIRLPEGIGIGILIVVFGRPADLLVVMNAESCMHA